MRKIDIQNHVLPGLDDGASDEEESMRMLKSAAKQGVISVIATPHYSAEYRNKKEEIYQACKKLEKRAREEINPKFSGETGSSYDGRFFLYISRVYAMDSLFRNL